LCFQDIESLFEKADFIVFGDGRKRRGLGSDQAL
jgi:hypothetical protein